MNLFFLADKPAEVREYSVFMSVTTMLMEIVRGSVRRSLMPKPLQMDGFDVDGAFRDLHATFDQQERFLGYPYALPHPHAGTWDWD